MRAVAFTGHRPEQLNGMDEDRLSELIFEEIRKCIDEGYDTFYCGAARGTDILCGELVVTLRDFSSYPIRLICVIPYREQAAGWDSLWKTRYRTLCVSADQNVLLSEFYYRGCYYARNRYMVDRADRVIAVYNGCGKGGTAYTVEYAKKQGKEIIIIDPRTGERTVIPA